MRVRRILRNALEPVAGVAFAGLWLVAEFARFPNLYVFALFGAAIAVSRLLPRTALALVLAGLAASTVGAAVFPPDLSYPAVESRSWLHQMTDTDWPAYAAALVVPALVVANARRTTVVRASLVVAALSPLWLAALIATASPALPWGKGRLIDWLGNWEVPMAMRVFVVFALILLVLSGLLWTLAWGIAAVARFMRTMMRDPLIRVRINDASRLGPDSASSPSLTTRERDVLLLVSDGKSNAEIATALFLSETTVKSHLRSILSKLGLKSRTEIAAYAWKTGLVQLV